jgi:hypothetical protein
MAMRCCDGLLAFGIHPAFTNCINCGQRVGQRVGYSNSPFPRAAETLGVRNLSGPAESSGSLPRVRVSERARQRPPRAVHKWENIIYNNPNITAHSSFNARSFNVPEHGLYPWRLLPSTRWARAVDCSVWSIPVQTEPGAFSVVRPYKYRLYQLVHCTRARGRTTDNLQTRSLLDSVAI